MNAFFQYPFTVTEIVYGARVLPAFATARHRNRASHGLVYKLEGSTEYLFADGKRFPFSEGQILYLPKYSDYDVLRIGEGACYAVNFHLADPKIAFPPFSLPEKPSEKYKPLFVELAQNFGSGTPGSEALCFSLLYRILSGIQRDHFLRYSSGSQSALAEKGAARLNECLGDSSLTVANVASELGMSEGYFRRLFLQVYGISPRKYLIARRIALAKELLLSEPISCREIAFRCGFESESYFSKEFRRHAGISASDFRRSF